MPGYSEHPFANCVLESTDSSERIATLDQFRNDLFSQLPRIVSPQKQSFEKQQQQQQCKVLLLEYTDTDNSACYAE